MTEGGERAALSPPSLYEKNYHYYLVLFYILFSASYER